MLISTRKQFQGSAIALVFAMATLGLLGQVTTGRVEGIVKDPSGSVVPSATVSLRNVDTNIQRKFTTADDGAYLFAAVPPGNYEISAEATGFSRETISFAVYSNQTSAQDLSLPLASQAAAVEVAASADFVATDAQRSVNRTTTEIEDLPGRGASLSSLDPGVSASSASISGGSQTGPVASSGGRVRAVSISQDYTDVNDWEYSGQALGSGLINDTIQEYKVVTSNFSAEQGFKSNAQIIVISKSGTNSFHGTAYDYIGNSFFNARSYLDTTGHPNVTRSNNYGLTGGGPIKKGQTFFYGAWEQTKTRGAGTLTIGDVPTPAAIATATDPLSVALLKAYVPLPTSPTSDPNVGTVTSLRSGPANSYRFQLRGDHRFNDNHFFYIRYQQDTSTSLLLLSNTIPGFDNNFFVHARSVSIGDTYILNPRTTNEFRASYGRSSGLIVAEGDPTVPRFTITGVVNFGAQPTDPDDRIFNTYQTSDILTVVRGTHYMKVGTDIRSIEDNSTLANNPNGSYIFPSLASFLAGQPSSWTQSFGPTERGYRTRLAAFFLQDDWKVRPNLTLNLGFRWELQGPLTEVNGLLSGLDVRAPGSIGAAGSGPLGTFHVGNPGQEGKIFLPSPRFGFAWSPRSNLVVRGGYGIFWDMFDFTALSFGRSVPPVNYNSGLAGSQISGANSFDKLLKGTAPVALQGNATLGNFGNFTDFGSFTNVDWRMKNPYSQNFSLGIDYSFKKSYLVRVGYVGTKGTQLTIMSPINPVVRGPAPATSLADEQARLSQFTSSIGLQNGVGNLRLDPRFDQISTQTSGANSIYHSLQTEFDKSFANDGLVLKMFYTWSKSIDEASDFTPIQQANDYSFPQNGSNWAADRAVSNYDIPQRWVMTLVWRVPFAKNTHGLTKRILDGWELSQINQWQSGNPYTLLAGSRSGISDVNLDGNLVTGQSSDNTRANCAAGSTYKLGNPVPAASLRGVNETSDSSNFPITQPLLGNDGTCGRNTQRLPAVPTFNWAFIKNVQLFEKGPLGSGPWNLQLRSEMSNVFNHAVLTASGVNYRTVSSSAFGVLNSATATRSVTMVVRLVW